MNKINLKWFLGKGYKLVVGDVWSKRFTAHTVSEDSVTGVNDPSDGDVNYSVVSFAWRNNEGAIPDCLFTDTVIDVKGNNGIEFQTTAFKCKQWHHTQDKSSNGAYYAMLKWRYNYESLLKQQEDDMKIYDIAKEDGVTLKPVFTQAQAGEWNSGDKAIKTNGNPFDNLVYACKHPISDLHILIDEVDNEVHILELSAFRKPKTDKENLIDDFESRMMSLLDIEPKDNNLKYEVGRLMEYFNITRKDASNGQSTHSN